MLKTVFSRGRLFANVRHCRFASNRHLDTCIVQPTLPRKLECKPSSVPIYQTATFEVPDSADGYDYSRSGNPTRSAVQSSLAEIEGAKHAILFSSGMAALSTAVCVVPGATIVAGDDIYGGTMRLLESISKQYNVQVKYVNTCDVAAVREVLQTRAGPHILLVESPSNPTLRVADISALSDACKSVGALLCVDNTMMSPWLQRPLELGADLVMHSATKLLSGHADVMAGALVTNKKTLAERCQFLQNTHGNGLSPFDCFLLMRGVKTLSVRLDKQQKSCTQLATFLERNELVEKVHFVGLHTHEDFDLHAKQSRGPGCVLSFVPSVNCNSQDVVSALKVFKKTVSFGSVVSVVEIPWLHSHASVPVQHRDGLRFDERLIRISCGLENVTDLIEDLDRALHVAFQNTQRRKQTEEIQLKQAQKPKPYFTEFHGAEISTDHPFSMIISERSSTLRRSQQRFSDSITTPIALTSAYFFKNTAELVGFCEGKHASFEYGRYGNPTTRVLEENLADLEGAEDCLFSSSGMNAATTMILALVPEGGHIVTTKDCYRRTRQFMKTFLPKLRITCTVVEMNDLAAIGTELALGRTNLFFSESPTNPYLRCVDMPALTEMCQEVGTTMVIDSTFATPVNQRALSQGADLVIHSATKYLAGHNDVLAGAVCGSSELIGKIRDLHAVLGGVLDPHAAYLTLRGLKTLNVRVRQQNASSQRLAEFLSTHDQIESVYYPGLQSHPDHEVAAKLMDGFGGVVSFTVKGGQARTSAFIDSLSLPFIAPSLGGVDSLVEQPAIISYYDYTPEQRLAQGITDNLVRFAVGIENEDEIVNDVAQALHSISNIPESQPENAAGACSI